MKLLALGYYKKAYSALRPEVELLIGLKKRGIDVEVICDANIGFGPTFADAGIKVHDHYPSGKVSLKSISFIKKIIKAFKPDIVQAFDNKTISNATLASIGFSHKMVSYRGATGVKWTDPTYFLTHLHPRIDAINCLSHTVFNSFKGQFLFKKPFMGITYKGQNIEWFKDVRQVNLEEIGIPKEAFSVICIANVRPIKGVEYFVDALKYIPDELPIHFIIIGLDSDTAEMKARAAATGKAEHIHLLGYNLQALNYLKAASCLVSPTISQEGLGRSVMEAMAFAKPIIATKSGGPEELLEEGLSGIFVERKNAQQIANAITSLYNNRGRTVELGANAKQRLSDLFSMEKYIENTLTFYNKVMTING